MPDPFAKTKQSTIGLLFIISPAYYSFDRLIVVDLFADFFQPTAEQARELALESRAQLMEAAAAQAGAVGVGNNTG